MLGGQARPNRATYLLVGAIIFVSLMVGLVWNHLDYWSATRSPAAAPPVHLEKPAPETGDFNAQLREAYLNDFRNPTSKVDDKKYSLYGAFDYELPKDSKPSYKKPLGENFCIIEMDNRPFDEEGQIFGPKPMSWSKKDKVHGLSVGMLNHWLYAKIHGYKYYYIDIEEYEDRRSSWKKPPVLSEILKDHDACVYVDSDAIFNVLNLPFEWLMNYWDIHPDNNSLALAFDPGSKTNQDKFGKTYLNTGFIILQNNEKTFEILDAWQKCPDDDSVHPGCKYFRTSPGGPGRPTDQGGFGTYIRYDFPEDIMELPCTEANGFIESKSGCAGTFIKHLWTGKSSWIKVNVGEQLPGKWLEIFHEQYLKERDTFIWTEKQLMAGETHNRTSAEEEDSS